MMSNECLDDRIAALYGELHTAKATLYLDMQDEKRLHFENSKLRARVYLAEARTNIRYLEKVEAQRNEAMLADLKKIFWALSSRTRRYKDLIVLTKKDNVRMIQEIRCFPQKQKEESNKLTKMQTLMIRLPLPGRRRRLLARSA